MGAGAGLSMNSTFKVVTKKAVFAMPGIYRTLSRCEYLGLTGRHLNGAEMVECGLATHFVPSKKLNLLENAMQSITSDKSAIAAVIDKFTEVAF
ncbi:hypothetical protein K1719_047600 [Acacia pycnantha]|nr:hypothetical protein K1719_047600 [Acacia pycnantha]